MRYKLHLKNISKLHPTDYSRYSLKKVNMTVAPGELVGVVGEKGSGKAALFNILGLMERPTTGAYLIDNRPTGAYNDTQLSDLRERTFGFLYRAFFLTPRHSALRNIILPLTQRGIETPTAKQRAQQQLAFVEAQDLEDKKPTELTLEQQQRIALARALATGNDVILIDEPFKPLDEQAQRQLMELFAKVNEQQQKTVVILTEKGDIAGPYCQRIINLEAGRIGK